MPDRRSSSRVAAIIATMNRPEYVRDAVSSACEQTYDPIEVIVVDGSDNDRTESVIEELRQLYPDTSITYLRNETPQGLPAARNQAITVTDAEYFAFLDDDDQWHPEKTARQMSLLRSSSDDVALVHSGFVGQDKDGNHLFTSTAEYDPPAYPKLLEKNIVATPSTVIVRRKAFEEIGGFDESLRYCEDWDLYLRLARRYRIKYVSDPLIDRTYHDDAMTEDLDTFFRYRERLLEKYADELNQHEMADSAWAYHYKLAGKKYLKAKRGPQARSAYRAALSLEQDIEIAVLCAVLHTLPIDLAVPTIQAIGNLKNRAQTHLRTIPLPLPT